MVSLPSALQAFTNDFAEDDPTVCPACDKKFKTVRGMSSHLGTAQNCRWYKKGKLKALVMPEEVEDEVLLSEEVIDPLPEEPWTRRHPEVDPSTVMEDYDDLLFELLPTHETHEEPHAGPSRRDRTEEDEDERVEEENEEAGAQWKKDFRGSKDTEGDVHMLDDMIEEDDRFSPFSSELDWRIAKWAIQEGIGHKSFDRLMSIPGVSD